jgi:hypothetical protein
VSQYGRDELSLESAHHLIGDLVHRLVLPEAQDGPPGSVQRVAHETIATFITVELRSPVVRVSVRHVPVLGAAVPEAAIDEHGNLLAREHDVWPYSEIIETKEQVDAETRTPGV